MLGDTGEHRIGDQQFVDWVRRENLLSATQVVVEWIDQNPLAQSDPV